MSVVTIPVALAMSLLLGMAFGMHTARNASSRSWPLLLAVLASWMCLEAVLSAEWICRPHNARESLAVGLLIQQQPFHLLVVAPAALSCAIAQRFGTRREGGHMSLARAFVIIIASGSGFGAAGCLVGYLLGRLAPGYYRAVFRSGGDASFDPVAVGVGLGLTQGMIAGLMIGAAAVAAVAWYRSRLRDQPLHPGPSPFASATDRPRE